MNDRRFHIFLQHLLDHCRFHICIQQYDMWTFQLVSYENEWRGFVVKEIINIKSIILHVSLHATYFTFVVRYCMTHIVLDRSEYLLDMIILQIASVFLSMCYKIRRWSSSVLWKLQYHGRRSNRSLHPCFPHLWYLVFHLSLPICRLLPFYLCLNIITFKSTQF